MKHLLSLLSTTPGEISDLLNLADQLKYENKHGIAHQRLKGQTLGMIFQNPQQEQGFLLKQVCISSAVRHSSFQTATFR